MIIAPLPHNPWWDTFGNYLIAAILALVAKMDSRRLDVVQQLVLRLRHPFRWWLSYPVQALRRWLR